MSQALVSAAPGWQTEELQDEWVELEPDEEPQHEHDNFDNNTRSISFTTPLPAHIIVSSDIAASRSISSSPVAGTFLIRDDVQNAPFLPKTPNRSKRGMKDIFAPLPLETMFEPPTPPEPRPSTSSARPPATVSHGSHGDILETYVPNMSSFQKQKSSMAYKFTFSVPRDVSARQNTLPQVPITPNPPFTPHAPPPATDPRLRLFQFQYDTYTRDQLSAMVDSIAMNTPSGSAAGTTPSPTTRNPILSRVSEVPSIDTSHLRSAKRVKLSPRTDFHGEGDGAGASISRPKPAGKDYVGESRTLMQKIKQARDFSTISTVASGRQGSPNLSDQEEKVNHHEASASVDTSRLPSFIDVPSRVPSTTSTLKSQASTSNKYRMQAAELMAQIRSDVKGQKRLFSNETATSKTSYSGEEKGSSHKRSVLGHSTGRPPNSLSSSNSSRTASLRCSQMDSVGGVQPLTDSLSRISVQEHGPLQNAPLPAISRSQNLQLPSLHDGTAPSYPLSALRNGTTADLNRFVSSSTASGATLTAGSAPSLVKHPGPAHMRTIVPADIPGLPDKLGEMIFDKVTMKWIKNSSHQTNRGIEVGSATEASDDPFGDIESLRDEVANTSQEIEPVREASQTSDEDAAAAMSRIEEQSEVDDEEMELTSFSTDASMHVVHVMTGVEGEYYQGVPDQSTDLGEGVKTAEAAANGTRLETVVDVSHERQNTGAQELAHLQVPPPSINSTSTPARPNQSSSAATSAIRSAMKSSSATPASVLKSANNRLQTPLQKVHRRSVSFSDGKRDGPIRGLSASRAGTPATSTSGTFQVSVRSKRITDMMNALEDSDSEFDSTESPSRTSSSGRVDDIRPLTERRHNQLHHYDVSGSRVSSKSYADLPSSARQTGNKANGTFLTECSFGVTHDRLVQVITDVQPFEPYWEELSAIDLSNKKLESVTRLKEFLPQLDVLNLNSNQLSWLSGVPDTVRTLSVAFNCLTELTSYSHLTNLENLDISRNEVESLRQLACLRHLHELKADGNRITSLEGLERMDGLVKLSLQGNMLPCLNCNQFKWTRMEMLNVSKNRLTSIEGLASLQSLIALNVDNNRVDKLETGGTMPKLRILRISGNRLQELNAASFPNLRTLYADNNSLATLVKLDRLSKLENLSLRNQRGRGLNIQTRDVRDVKRLYLSGNAIKSGFFEENCYNLVYLELAACRLTALPEELAKLVPNLRVLNLNYNFLEDIRPLEGLTRLRKLSIIGSRVQGTRALIRVVQRMPEAEMFDFRMNPCTLGWYLPLLVKDAGGALSPSEGRGRWQEMDSKFRRDLPDETYCGRLAYRGLVMGACPKVGMLDGVEMSEKERRKAEKLLAGILGRRSDGDLNRLDRA